MTGTTTSPLSCFYTKLLSGFLILAFLVLFFFVRARPLLYIVLCLVIVRRFSRFSLLRYCGELVKGMGGSVRTPSTNGTDTLSRQLFYRKVGGAPSVGGSRSYGPNTLTHCFFNKYVFRALCDSTVLSGLLVENVHTKIYVCFLT